MRKAFKGLAVAAAMLWAGSAQAALIKYEFIAFGDADSVISYSPYTEVTYRGGPARAIFSVTVNSDELYVWQGQERFGVTPGQDKIGASYHYDSDSPADISTSALFEPGFVFGPSPVFGDITPLSGHLTYSKYFFRAGYENFSGNLVSVSASLVSDPAAVPRSDFHLIIYGVPEPSTWAMLLVGFGVVGAAMRRRPAQALSAA